MADNPNPFDTLPIETNQHIATFLEGDSDLCNYRSICHSTHDAIDADNCSFWRRRFQSEFEKPVWPRSNNNARFKEAYQRRRNVLKNGAAFTTGDNPREKACLDVLKDLVIESFSERFAGTSDAKIYESHNLEKIQKFLVANDLLQVVFKPLKRSTSRYDSTAPPVPLPFLYTIQVICAPMLLSFNPHILDYHYGFPDSQAIVYSTPKHWPIFGGVHGLNINMPFILHNLNFWKYHMVREVENTLFNAFEELADDEKPRWWSTQPKQGEQSMGKHWKGTYSFVDRGEIETMRRGENDHQIQDRFAGEDESFTFQDMRLHIAGKDETMPWPPIFERHLRSLTPPMTQARTRAQKRCAAPDAISQFRPRSFRFDGDGQDVSEEFYASGWLNPLPEQHGVPGWHRMTMMKYFHDEDDVPIDNDALWAYEGVVLPGGQIILGRWWSPSNGNENQYSGPFILWCVDGPKHAEAATEKADEEKKVDKEATDRLRSRR